MYRYTTHIEQIARKDSKLQSQVFCWFTSVVPVGIGGRAILRIEGVSPQCCSTRLNEERKHPALRMVGECEISCAGCATVSCGSQCHHVHEFHQSLRRPSTNLLSGYYAFSFTQGFCVCCAALICSGEGNNRPAAQYPRTASSLRA
jgi:hypothetical protein